METKKTRFNFAAITMSLYSLLYMFTVFYPYVKYPDQVSFSLNTLVSTIMILAYITHTVSLYIKKRTILPFISLAVISFFSVTSAFSAFAVLFGPDVEFIIKFSYLMYIPFALGFVFLTLTIAMTTFRRHLTPNFFKKCWFIPGLCFVVYYVIGISVLVYSGKIGTNFVPVIVDALLTISAFISPKWFVDVYAAQPVQNTPEETEECDTILQ